MLLARRKLIDRIARRGASVTALVAPAGFGKSYVAHQLAILNGRWTEIDCTETADIEQRIAAAAEPRSDSATIVLENAERLEANPIALQSIVALLQQPPENARLVVCSRTERALRFSDHVPPHVLAMVRADQLAFDEDETREAFAGTRASDASVYRIRHLTEGWPVPVLLFAQLAGDDTLEDPASYARALGDLYDYLDGHVVLPIEEPVLRALVTSAGLGDVRIDDFEALFGAHTVQALVRAMTRDYQVARLGREARLHVHPLVAAVIRERHAGEQREAVRALANACLRRGDAERAIQCFLSTGDVQKAAEVYTSFLMSPGDVALHSLSLPDTCDTAALTFYPELWVGVIGARRLTTRPHTLLSEAERVFDGVPPDCPDLLFNAVLASYALTLKDAGRMAEARALLERARMEKDAESDGSLHVLAVRARLESVEGRHTEALQTLRKIERRLAGEPTWLSQLLRIDISAARARGRWEVEYHAVDRMLDVSRKAGAPAVIAMALAEGAFGAWLAGEESLFEAYRSQLDVLMQQQQLPVLLNFDLALLGRGLERSYTGSFEWDSPAYLIAATNCDDAGRAAEYAQAAVELADNAGVALLRVLSRIAVAEKLPATRSRRLQEALDVAKTIDSAPLSESVQHLLERGEPKGMLSPFVNRLRRRSTLLNEEHSTTGVLISLADGSVYRDGSVIHVSEGGWALLAALAVEGRAVGRETLCDRLWPDMPLESASNALKMCVRRTRQQLGDANAIVSINGGYALAGGVEIDLPKIDAARAAIARGNQASLDVAAFERLFERLRAGRPASFANWEWFEETEWQLQAATRELGEFLARSLLSRNDVTRTLEIGRVLIALDPLDEGARKVTISAHLAANDRNAALIEFRRYQKILKDELAAEPSQDLKQMVSAV